MSIIEKAVQIFKKSGGKIRPHVFVSGPSGSGKTHNTNLLAVKYDIPMIKINAAQLTKEGYSGQSLSKVLVPLSKIGNKPNIIYVDEFDKLLLSDEKGAAPSDITIGVQNEFLDLLESNSTNVIGLYGHYDKVNISKTLFIFSGAFNGTPINEPEDLLGFGVKTEFIGRIPLYQVFEEMSMDTLLYLVDEAELLDFYLELHPDLNREREIKLIKDKIIKRFESNFLGARIINNTIHRHFLGVIEVDSDFSL